MYLMMPAFLSGAMIESKLRHPPPLSSFQVRVKLADRFDQQKDRDRADDCQYRDLIGRCDTNNYWCAL